MTAILSLFALGTVVPLRLVVGIALAQAAEADRHRFVVPADALPDFVRFVPNGVPRSWVESEGGAHIGGEEPPELPGLYLSYRHGDLEYLFGPYAQRGRLTLDRSLLLGLEDSLQRRDAAIYRFVEISIARVVGSTVGQLTEAEEVSLYDPLFRDAELLDGIQGRLAGHEFGSPIGIDALTRIGEDLEVIRAGGAEESLGQAVEVARRFLSMATAGGEEALHRMAEGQRKGLRRRAEEAVWKEVTGGELPPGQEIGAAANGLDLGGASGGLRKILATTDPATLTDRMSAGALPSSELWRMASSINQVDLVAARAAVAFLAEQEVQERVALAAGSHESVMNRARMRAESGEELSPWEGRMLAEAMRHWTEGEQERRERTAVEAGAHPERLQESSSPVEEDPVLDLLRIGLRLVAATGSEGGAQGALKSTFQPQDEPLDKPTEDLKEESDGVLGEGVGGSSKSPRSRSVDPRLEKASLAMDGIEEALEGRGLPGTDAAVLAGSFQRLAGEVIVRRLEQRAGIPSPAGPQPTGPAGQVGRAGRSGPQASPHGPTAVGPTSNQIQALFSEAGRELGTATTERVMASLDLAPSRTPGGKPGQGAAGPSTVPWSQVRENLVRAAGQEAWNSLSPGGTGPDATSRLGKLESVGATPSAPGLQGSGASGPVSMRSAPGPGSQVQPGGSEPGGFGTAGVEGGGGAESDGGGSGGDGDLPNLFNVELPEVLEYLSPFGPFTDDVIEWLADTLNIDPGLAEIFVNPLGYLVESGYEIAEAAGGELVEVASQSLRMVEALIEGDFEEFVKAGQKLMGALADMTVLNESVIRAVQPLLSPLPFLRGELMEPPDLMLRNPGGFTGAPVYYVNGINTPAQDARDDADALSKQVRRPVLLIHNQSGGIEADLGESAIDRLWLLNPFKSFGQHNATTRQVTYVLYHATDRISIVTHSQGCIIFRNALNTAHAFRGGGVAEKVAWVATGVPLREMEVYPRPGKYRALRNEEDPVAQIVGFRFDPDSLTEQDFGAHSFQDAYVAQIRRGDLWPDENSFASAFPSGGLQSQRGDPAARAARPMQGKFSASAEQVVRTVLATPSGTARPEQDRLLGYALMQRPIDQITESLAEVSTFLDPGPMDPRDATGLLMTARDSVRHLNEALNELDRFSWDEALDSRPDETLQFLSARYGLPREGVRLLMKGQEEEFYEWAADQVAPVVSAMLLGDQSHAAEWTHQYTRQWIDQLSSIPAATKAAILNKRHGAFRQWLESQPLFDSTALRPAWIDWAERIRNAKLDDVDEIVRGLDTERRFLGLERYR